jgi:hypothetical protein
VNLQVWFTGGVNREKVGRFTFSLTFSPRSSGATK